MKMIIRADDVGYTDIHNVGTFETIDNGVVTSADIMLDSPGTVDALERLKNYPWISVGWHTHFWGAPVLGSEKVPSMYDKTRNGFRKNLFSAEDVVFEEALAECRAQLERCVKILGRAPDTGSARGNSTFSRAMQQACDEYGLVGNFMTQLNAEGFLPAGMLPMPVEERWASRKIIAPSPMDAVKELMGDSLSGIEAYNPILFYTEDRGKFSEMPEDCTVMTAWHPGYVDYYVYRLGDYGPLARNFITARTVDVMALCSDELKNWIKEKGVELVNFRDALYGTREYQNHLRQVNSNLAVR